MKKITKQEALKKAEALCAKREYCLSEIKQKLFQWHVNTDDHDFILSSLINDKFIDESRYVEFFVRDKFKLNKWGKIKIEYALKSKGISQTLIKENLDKINENDYIEVCKLLINNKYQSLKPKEENIIKLKEKIFRFAHSRGFETELIKDIYNKQIS